MRITIVQGPFLPVPPLRGGAVEKVWFALGQKFARRGHTVTHVSRRFPGLPDEETIEGVCHLRVGGFDPPPSWRLWRGIDVLWPLRLVWDFLYAWRARRVLPDADILVTNTFWLPTLIRPGSRRGRLYVHVQRFPKAQVRLYAHADRLQTVSTSIARALLERLPNCAEKIRVIPNPLLGEISWSDENEILRRTDTRARTTLFVGRVHPAKGLDLLIRAFAKFRSLRSTESWTLRIVGPHESALGGGGMPFLEQLKKQAESVGCPVEFSGFLADPTGLRAELSDAQMFVYPSLDELGEASPVAPLEAMGCGCPVIVSDLACFRDYLTPEETGFVFDHRPTHAVDNLAACLERLAADPSLRQRVALNAWRATRSLTLIKVADLFLADFSLLVSTSTESNSSLAERGPR